MGRGAWLALLGALGAAGLVALASGGNDAPSPGAAPGGSQEPEGGGVSGAPPKPIAVGDPKDPELASLLQQMRDEWASSGVRVDWFDPVELTTMRKAPGRPVAIPPREYWQRMARTLLVVQELRAELGPLTVYNGYRPADYNKAVGGAKGSRHQWFEAVDMYPTSGEAAQRRTLARAAALLFLRRGHELAMGFGVYGTNTPSVHVDTGHKRRTWGDAQHFIDQVEGVA